MSGQPENSCFLCGSIDLTKTKYLRLNSVSLARNVGYALPTKIGKLLSLLSSRFAAVYHPILVNKKYFDRQLIFCRNCATGHAQPFFSEESLTGYYSEFYWANRDRVDGKHRPDEDVPNSIQTEWSENRIAWINKQNVSYSSVIDFGAGDCAATYAFLQKSPTTKVHVVDPSVRAKELAQKYGATYSANLEGAPVVDLIYSAHSIEHVHDLLLVLSSLISRTRKGAYIFIETPNIGDEAIFKSLVHTPHTFMISKKSILKISELMNLRVVAMESSGPHWRDSRPRLASEEKADLRILLQTRLAT